MLFLFFLLLFCCCKRFCMLGDRFSCCWLAVTVALPFFFFFHFAVWFFKYCLSFGFYFFSIRWSLTLLLLFRLIHECHMAWTKKSVDMSVQFTSCCVQYGWKWVWNSNCSVITMSNAIWSHVMYRGPFAEQKNNEKSSVD